MENCLMVPAGVPPPEGRLLHVYFVPAGRDEGYTKTKYHKSRTKASRDRREHRHAISSGCPVLLLHPAQLSTVPRAGKRRTEPTERQTSGVRLRMGSQCHNGLLAQIREILCFSQNRTALPQCRRRAWDQEVALAKNREHPARTR